MMPRSTCPAIAMMAVALLSACSSTPAPPETTASPTYNCTPEKGGAPLPCGPIEYEQAQKRDAHYAEAEAVYRRYWTELDRLTLLEAPTFTPEMAETTSGNFEAAVRTMLSPEYPSQRVQGEASLVRIDRLPGFSRSGSTVALLVCIDARGAKYKRTQHDEPIPGIAYEMRVYLARVAGVLKLVDVESRDVKSC